MSPGQQRIFVRETAGFENPVHRDFRRTSIPIITLCMGSVNKDQKKAAVEAVEKFVRFTRKTEEETIDKPPDIPYSYFIAFASEKRPCLGR